MKKVCNPSILGLSLINNNKFFFFLDAPQKKKRKRISRWTDESEKTCIPGMPTIIPGNMTPGQEKAYLSNLNFLSIYKINSRVIFFNFNFNFFF